MFKLPGPEGFVYLLWSHYLGQYKIGLTRRGAQDRTRELNKKRNMDWEVIASIETEDPLKLERLFHTVFAEVRVHPKREFFRLTPEQVDLFIALAEAQGWASKRAYEAGIDEGYDRWETLKMAREIFGTQVGFREQELSGSKE